MYGHDSQGSLISSPSNSGIINSRDIISGTIFSGSSNKAIILTGAEDLTTPYDDLLDKVNFIPIKKISKPFYFKKGLFVTEYRKIIEEKLKKKYPEAFKINTINNFFFNAAAQYTYSNDGRLDPEFYNMIVDGRKKYFEVKKYIMQLKFHRLIKVGLQYLTARSFIYTHTSKSADKAKKKLAKIPDYPLLYVLNPPDFLIPKNVQNKEKDESAERNSTLINSSYEELQNTGKTSEVLDKYGNVLYGNYLRATLGSNLYYICASCYKNFVNLPIETRKKILEYIYSFNITLTESKPIRADNSLYSYILGQINLIKRDPLLKYRLSLDYSWILLPNSINNFETENKNHKKEGNL